MDLDIYQVDAFAIDLFKGNPAMVVPLTEWLSSDLMQSIAAENNLSETAFYVRETNGFYIRWFTPTTEVKLCGHATLATAFVVFLRKEIQGNEILFNCKSGPLKVIKSGGEYILNFPTTQFEEIQAPKWIKSIGGVPKEFYKCDDDFLFVFQSRKEIEALNPDFNILGQTKSRGIMCTSADDEFDFVSRFFAPAAGINEDPVTGSAHTKLVPFWSKRLNKNNLVAKQISKRGGVINCQLLGDRVNLKGSAKLYLTGKIHL